MSNELKTRKIRRGETLSGIAGGRDTSELMAANPNIRDPNKIRAGASINVPVVGVTRAKKAPSAVASSQKQKKKSSKAPASVKANAYRAAQDQARFDRARKSQPKRVAINRGRGGSY